MTALRIGTRGSELALFQARSVASLLHHICGLAAEIVVIKTSGDRLSEAPLSEIGGKRLFVKEIEDALLEGRVDLAVHSSKDMPVVLPDRLQISAVLEREDARDAVVLAASRREQSGDGSLAAITRALGREPRIGTSSVRRIAQMRRLWPAANFLPVRGNLDTRLRKLDAGDYDALVLAAAGLRRLGRADRITSSLPIDACVPAPGQGIIAIETRHDDEVAIAAAARIADANATAALAAERAVIARLGGGCQMPIGAYAEIRDRDMLMTAVVVSLDGARAGGSTVGFVPTMGYLHDGHASLLRRAAADNDVRAASIFVNPLQFAADEDLGTYPRDLDRDLAIMAGSGVDHVLVPSVEEMYPEPVLTTVTVGEITERFEGAARPEHFAGVATVVAKLFSIVGPCRAYFGEKDYQQLAVVTRMASDLSMPVEFGLENMAHFIDWQRKEPFQVIRGEGECAV